MNQTGAVAVTRTEQIFIRDQESDCDDDDRRQLIIQYANDTYLSKWDVADNSEGKDDKPNVRLTVKVPNSNAKIDQEDSCQAESGHLGTTYDCDELSLVSYNSLRDGTSLALPKTAPASLSCQLPFAGGKEELKLFQGYGGNIYFDAVRCKSMIINSTKSVRPKKQASSDNCKSNSRISSKRDVVDQVHTSCVSSSPTEAPTSTHVLGSLRMRSCKEKIWRPGESRHKDTKRHLSGKICKGFSEKLLTETFQKFYEKQGNSVAGKPMVVSGGSVGHATAVDSIGNNQIGFPALISNSSFFSHRGRQKSPEVVDSDDGNPFMKLPFLKKYEGKKKTRKSDGKKLGEERKMVNEVSSVFIIPFGAFDDPVDFESQDVKRKVDNKEKASTIGDTCENGGYSSLENRKGRFLEKSSEFDSVLVPARFENHNIKDTVACSDDNGNSAKHPSPDPRAKTLMKAAQPGSANLFVKREISNISLSNYLRAVPTRVSKEPVQVTSSQSYTKPKISYTKRSQALSTLYMVNNTHHAAKASQKMTASQLSRGCIPNTSGKESQLFYAEISTCADGNSLKSDDYRQDSHRRSQSSGNFIKTLRSSQAPKHAFVKANYVSRSSSTHQGPEQASTIFDPVRNSQKNVFPITGQQISGLSGVQDR